MLKFKTLLLWIAFTFLAIEQLFTLNSTTYLFFRMIPIGSMIVWFIISLFNKNNFKINPLKVTHKNAWILRYVRPIASLLIIFGAAAKLLRWPYSDMPLIFGIGCMALYYTALSRVAEPKKDYLPDVIDDSVGEENL
jgi:hypothetical protein